MAQVTGVIKAKARTNKAFKLDDNKWYEVSGATEEFLTKMEKPYPNVEVTYEQAGYKRKATFIKPINAGEQKSTAEQVKSQTIVNNNTVVDTGSVTKPKAFYGRGKQEASKPTQEYWDKKDLAIKKGNALNASAYALSGTEADIDVLGEKVVLLAQKLYEYLTLED